MATDRFNPNLNWWQGVLIVSAMIGVVVLMGQCLGGKSHNAVADAADTRTPQKIAEDNDKAAEQLRAAGEAAVKARAAAEAPPPEHQWYEGGTLSQANGLEWQEAKLPNKLATAADILAKLWTMGKLKPKIASKIHSVDDLRDPATDLVIALDRALEKQGTAEQNRQTFTNQNVSEIAIVLMKMMAWI